MLQVENGLAVLPHLSGQPAKPCDGLVEWIVFPVSFVLHHMLYIVGPDLLLEDKPPLGSCRTEVPW